MSISQKKIWLQVVILKKLQMFDVFLSNDKLNVFRIGIHTFHAYFAGTFWLFKPPMFYHFLLVLWELEKLRQNGMTNISRVSHILRKLEYIYIYT